MGSDPYDRLSQSADRINKARRTSVEVAQRHIRGTATLKDLLEGAAYIYKWIMEGEIGDNPPDQRSKQDPARINVSALGLETPKLVSLYNKGIHTMGDLMRMGGAELSRFDWMDDAQLEQIRVRLHALGLGALPWLSFDAR